MLDAGLLARSVQDRREPDERDMPFGLSALLLDSPNNELPAWWSMRRDQELRKYYKRDGLLASTVYSMQAIVAGTGWTVEGDSDRRVSQARLLLDNAEFGQGVGDLMKAAGEDWLVQDNGMMIEIVGDGLPHTPLTSPPIAVAHLDAGRCWRSGDPEHPIWYLSERNNKWQRLHWTRCFYAAANPSSMEIARGLGFCAVSRIAELSAAMQNFIRYRKEKSSGRYTRGMIISNLSKHHFQSAFDAADELGDNAGNVRYSPLPIVAANNPNFDPVAFLLELASLPDGFDWQTEITVYMYMLALAFGLDARELWPATTSGATKGDAEVQHRKAMRKGVGDFLQKIEWFFNHRVLPDGVRFEFKPKDSEEDQAQATLEKTRVDTVEVMINTGVVTPYGGRRWLVNAGVLPSEYLRNPDLAPLSDEGQGEEPVRRDENEVNEPPSDIDSEPKVEGEIDKGGLRDFLRRLFSRRPARLLSSIKNLNDFNSGVRALVRGLWSGVLTEFQFVDGMVSALSRYLREAWYAGLQRADIQPEEMSDEERMAMERFINSQYPYVINFAQAVSSGSQANGGKLAPLFNRARLWTNRYGEAENQAFIMASQNQKMRWTRNPQKDSCETCLALDGRVYRAETWHRNGVWPRSPRLRCFPGPCGCTLERTSDRITPGRFPTSILQ